MAPRVFFCVLSLLLPALGGCVVSQVDDSLAHRRVEAEVPFDPARAVTIEGDNGDIRVRRTDTPVALVRADIRSAGQKRLDSVQVVMQTNAEGDLSIRVDWPVGWRLSGEAATLEVDLPGCAGLTVNTGNGAIDVAGLAGRCLVSSGNGEITIADHQGDVEASTSNGYVQVDRVTGECRVRTSNGQVTLSEIGGRLSIATTNGAVEVRLSEGNPGPMDIRTANGSVEVELGSGFTGDLRLETFNGRVRVVDVAGEVEIDDEREWAVIHRGGSSNRSLIRTSNGRIEVRKR